MVELLVIVAVTTLLVVVVILMSSGVESQSDQAACNADVKLLLVAIQAYESQTGNTIPPANGTTMTQTADDNRLVPTYLRSWPGIDSRFTIAFSSRLADTITVTPDGGRPESYDAQTGSGTPAGCLAVS